VKRPALSLDGIRAILFDLDGTLRHSRPSYNDVFFGAIADMGVDVTQAKRQKALRWAHYYFAGSPEILQDDAVYGHDRDLFLSNYVRRWLVAYGCEPNYADQLTNPIYQRLRNTHPLDDCVYPDVPATLQSLKQAGYTLGVVSNRSEDYRDLLDELGFGCFFDFAVAAGVVDSWKPDSAIFIHALQCAETSPDRALFVGDNYYADIIGAQRVGLRPVLYDPENLFPDANCPVIRSIGELSHGLE
jgi:FMN phosphatase YigB (HAD superfamily)